MEPTAAPTPDNQPCNHPERRRSPSWSTPS
jgi:hypothetical protein